MYVILNGEGVVAETAASQLQAFRRIDWLTTHEHEQAPFTCAPAA